MKPNGADLYLLYTCPDCSQVHSATIKETKFPGGVLCYCGHQIKFDPIEHVHMKIDYGIRKEERKAEKVKDRAYRGDVMKALTNLGYKSSDVSKAYKKVYDSIPDHGNVEDIIQRVLRAL